MNYYFLPDGEIQSGMEYREARLFIPGTWKFDTSIGLWCRRYVNQDMRRIFWAIVDDDKVPNEVRVTKLLLGL